MEKRGVIMIFKWGQYDVLLLVNEKRQSKNGILICSFGINSGRLQRFLILLPDYLRKFHRILIPLHQNYRNLYIMANLNRIKIVLFEHGRTGKWLADELGKSPCTISKWCQNTIQPDLSTLDKIAQALNVDVKELITSTEKVKR